MTRLNLGLEMLGALAMLNLVACDGTGAAGDGGTVDVGGDDLSSLSATTLNADGTDYYLTLVSEQPAASGPYRIQLNFGTEAEIALHPDEPGQNSTFGLVLTFLEEPTTSGTATFSSSRFPTEAGTVNFYQSFFFNRGTARDGANYLSPDAGSLSFTLEGGHFSADLATLVMTNEAETSDSFEMSGRFDFDWP